MSDPMPETINMSFKARRALFESKKNGNSSREDSVGGAALTGGQNKPLTCLSVNVTNVRHEIDQKDVKFLKQEISDLQKRITKLDATKNKDLLELMKSKNQESEEKEEHLKQLNEKLLQIQTGLREIESERQQLIKKAKALEDEKMELKEQLRLRDKEIQSLTKRCSSHTDDRKVSTNSDYDRALSMSLWPNNFLPISTEN
jgi:DNA repair exonuclease SbcCD ATPase subunit